MRLAAVLWVTLLLGAFPAAAEGHLDPRPLSDAEIAAVEIAAKFLDGGSPAILEDLAPTSPLRSDSRDALREMSARLGPHRNVDWALQTVGPSLADKAAAFGVRYPSGISDVIVFEMTQLNGRWQIAKIRSQGEPVPPVAALTPPKAEPVSRLDGRLDKAGSSALALPALLLGLVTLSLRGSRRTVAIIAAALASLCVSAAAFFTTVLAFPALVPGASQPVVSSGTVPEFIPLAALVDMREAIAAGDTPRARQLYGRLPDGEAREVAMLWKLQVEQRDERTAGVAREIPRVRWRRYTPLAQLLLARAAYLEDRFADAVIAYESAIAIGPARDGLLFEVALTLATIGSEQRPEAYLNRAMALRSREPVLHYVNAELRALDGDQRGAEEAFLQGWKMRPVARGEALSKAILWRVFRQPRVAAALQLSAAGEAAFAAPRRASMRAPSGAEAEVSGDQLLLRIADSTLEVAGGGSIAPAHAQISDALEWQRRERAELLAELDQTRTRALSPGALVDAEFRDRLVATGDALAAQNDWDEILALTHELDARDEKMPIELMVLRGHALSRADRPADLKKLIVDLLANPAVKKRDEPEPLIAIAELLVGAGLDGEAIALYERAFKTAPLPGIEFRLLQLEIERALSIRYVVHKTAHFDIIFPPELPVAHAEMAGSVLESEYARLRTEWLPGPELPRTRVNLLWWEDFSTYAGSPYIAGLYTDEIFLPMAGVTRFSPETVAIMTHELFHAMLAQATGDLAPRWFHEAFASRIEMAEQKPNAFQYYRGDRFISLAVLDDVAANSPDPDLVHAVYRIGEATLRYVEARWGRSALLRLVAEFANGAASDAAVQNALGVSIGELDRQARAWGLAQPMSFSGHVVRYDQRRPEISRRRIVR